MICLAEIESKRSNSWWCFSSSLGNDVDLGPDDAVVAVKSSHIPVFHAPMAVLRPRESAGQSVAAIERGEADEVRMRFASTTVVGSVGSYWYSISYVLGRVSTVSR